jgi:hypothetical protein
LSPRFFSSAPLSPRSSKGQPLQRDLFLFPG